MGRRSDGGVADQEHPDWRRDDIKMDASYTKGRRSTVSFNFAELCHLRQHQHSRRLSEHRVRRNDRRVYLPVAAGGDGSLHLTRPLAFAGRSNNWDPYWSSSLFGSYVGVRYDGAAKAFICANHTTPAKAVSADYICNPDFNLSQLGVTTRWTPVTNLTFSAEFMWVHLDQNFQGSAVPGASAPKPAARYEFSDQDTFHLQLRGKRNC